jgi:REP element-mobilizing transposase RayT
MSLKRQSKAEIYLHLVWATRLREPLITPEVERAVHRCAEAEAKRLGCVVLALNGMPDHVHLFVRTPTRVSAAELARQVKGVSSHFVNNQLPDGEGFRWQEGYGVFSVSRSHVQRVIAYVEKQKDHHHFGTIWPEWEETDKECTVP